MDLRDEARRMRRDDELSVAEIQRRLGVTKHALTSWLTGIPAPEWTRRPNAKDELRSRALDLRADGWSVNDIALELGIAKSTAYLWVKHLPLDPDAARARGKRDHARIMSRARWQGHHEDRDQARAEAIQRQVRAVGAITDRDLLLVGAAVYWCEGTKSKPWRRDERLAFINSDPVLILIFLRFVRLVGVDPAALRVRVSIHESADATAAARWWSERTGIPLDSFARPTLKKHRVTSFRHNQGDDYHGCLILYVRRSRELYWQVEGVMQALAGGT